MGSVFAGLIGATMALVLSAVPLASESVDLKYRGKVDLLPFSCMDVIRSSFINRVCYDRANEYMLISLNGIYYHYCEIDSGTIDSLMGAESMGRYYNASIRGRFDCRSRRVPTY
jgi:hypothetical protein